MCDVWTDPVNPSGVMTEGLGRIPTEYVPVVLPRLTLSEWVAAVSGPPVFDPILGTAVFWCAVCWFFVFSLDPTTQKRFFEGSGVK